MSSRGVLGKAEIEKAIGQEELREQGDCVMVEEDKKSMSALSATTLLERLFKESLADPEQFDAEVLSLVKEHLGREVPHSRAGNNLASALVELAIRRTEGSEK